MQVREVMTPDPVTVREEDDLAVALQLMLWRGVRHLPVVRASGDLVGLLSQRDAFAHGVRVSREAARDRVGDTMVRPVEVIAPDADVLDAAERMAAKRLGCLPVVADRRLVGIVTRTDLLRAQIESAARAASARRTAESGGESVASLMREPVQTAGPGDYLLDAAARMVQQAVRHLPIVDGEGRVIGMLSDRDVRNAIGDLRRAFAEESVRDRVRLLKVVSVMHAPPVTLRPHASVAEAAELFVDRRVGAIPVVDERRHLLGILSYVDVIGALRPHVGAPARI